MMKNRLNFWPLHVGDWRVQGLLRRICLIAISALCAVQPAPAAELTTSAQYIVGFVRYVRWPAEETIDTWHICVADGVSADQDGAYANESVNGKRFSVQHIAASDTVTSCQVLDLTGMELSKSAELLRRVRHLPVLTVGRGDKFCSQGGLICLHPQESDQKFEVNLTAVKDSGLNISARLLRLGSPRVTSTESAR